jgi:hypothetical protein
MTTTLPELGSPPEWAELVEQKAKLVSGQLGQKPPGRPEGGSSQAARDLGVSRKQVELESRHNSPLRLAGSLPRTKLNDIERAQGHG